MSTDFNSGSEGKLPYRLINVEAVRFLPADAQLILNETAEFKHQRAINHSRVELLKEEMSVGNFIFEAVTLVIAELDGTKYLLNGQHVCHAIIKVGVQLKEIPEVRKLTYVVEDYHGLSQLYVALTDTDDHRTKFDVLMHYLMCGRSWYMKKHNIRLIAKGYLVWKFPVAAARTEFNPKEVAQALLSDFFSIMAEINEVLVIFESGDNKSLNFRKQAVVAAMFGTFEKDPVQAKAFWLAVGLGSDDLSATDPSQILRKKLINWKVSKGTSGNDDQIAAMIRCCIVSWNAYRSGKQTS